VKLVLRLQERGFTLAAIGELLTAWEAGHDLQDVLGLESALTRPWTAQTPVPMSHAELEAKLRTTLGPDEVEQMTAAGLVRADDGGYLALNPLLIENGGEMIGMGIPVPTMLQIIARLSDEASRMADWITEMVAPHLTADTPSGLPEVEGGLTQMVQNIDRLRALSAVSVAEFYAMGLERAVADYVGRVNGWAMESSRSASDRSASDRSPADRSAASDRPAARD
jgi:DNA-binding transcriptional MerR regulator